MTKVEDKIQKQHKKIFSRRKCSSSYKKKHNKWHCFNITIKPNLKKINEFLDGKLVCKKKTEPLVNAATQVEEENVQQQEPEPEPLLSAICPAFYIMQCLPTPEADILVDNEAGGDSPTNHPNDNGREILIIHTNFEQEYNNHLFGSNTLLE